VVEEFEACGEAFDVAQLVAERVQELQVVLLRAATVQPLRLPIERRPYAASSAAS
jgi:hypothetical protein